VQVYKANYLGLEVAVKIVHGGVSDFVREAKVIEFVCSCYLSLLSLLLNACVSLSHG
jgi:hypothetical protein